MTSDEQRTADAHRAMSAAAWPVVRGLAAEDGASQNPPPAPPPPPGTAWPRPPTPDPVDAERRRAAVEAGWIVALAPPPRPTSDRDDRPLRGYEIAVKDLIDVAGLPVRNGTPGGLWREPTVSAPAWERLARAGAHCLGKTATHEMAWGLTTPQVGNPHDARRFAGGSSGGSAAVVAAGAAHAALGTDTGGSVRVPAALCGVVGIRPTHGAVDATGVTPMAPSQDVVGPLTPDVATCALLLEQMLGRPLGGASPRHEHWRVGVLESPGALEPDVAAAYARTLDRLARAGVDVVPLPSAPLREAGSVSYLTMLAESARLHADAVRDAPDGFGAEFRGIIAAGERLRAEHPDATDVLAAARNTLRVRTGELFTGQGLDAVLTPTTPCVAPRRDQRTVRLGSRDVPVGTALSRFTGWSAATGWPAISVPISGDGLPVGVQLMTRPHREDVALRLAGITVENEVAE